MEDLTKAFAAEGSGNGKFNFVGGMEGLIGEGRLESDRDGGGGGGFWGYHCSAVLREEGGGKVRVADREHSQAAAAQNFDDQKRR